MNKVFSPQNPKFQENIEQFKKENSEQILTDVKINKKAIAVIAAIATIVFAVPLVIGVAFLNLTAGLTIGVVTIAALAIITTVAAVKHLSKEKDSLELYIEDYNWDDDEAIFNVEENEDENFQINESKNDNTKNTVSIIDGLDLALSKNVKEGKKKRANNYSDDFTISYSQNQENVQKDELIVAKENNKENIQEDELLNNEPIKQDKLSPETRKLIKELGAIQESKKALEKEIDNLCNELLEHYNNKESLEDTNKKIKENKSKLSELETASLNKLGECNLSLRKKS